jgi:hypothetical protein
VNDILSFIPQGFIGALASGMLVNFKIASLTLLFSLLIGGSLVGFSLAGGFVGKSIGFFIALIRAMPTFLVMISLLYLLPRQIVIAGSTWPLSNVSIVVLSLLPYAVAYVFDHFLESVRQWRLGQIITALQLLPNLMRMYFVLIMSSASGAAIGVTEGVATLVRYAMRIEAIDQRLMLFAVGIICFGIIMQSGFVVVNLVRAALISRFSKQPQS